MVTPGDVLMTKLNSIEYQYDTNTDNLKLQLADKFT